jgi:hypothetical protein
MTGGTGSFRARASRISYAKIYLFKEIKERIE